jgi:predicted transcriptional regulator
VHAPINSTRGTRACFVQQTFLLHLFEEIDGLVNVILPLEVGKRLGSYIYLRKRSDIAIIADILIVAKADTLKTHIMYKCNLSHRQLETYLNFLLEIGLLKSHLNEENKARYYEITSKGLEFLMAYSKLKDLMS